MADRDDLQVVGWADCPWRPKAAEDDLERELRKLAKIIEEGRRQKKLREQKDDWLWDQCRRRLSR